MRKIILGSIIALFMVADVFAEIDFSEKKSRHFIIYYKDVPEDFVDTTVEYAERYYEELTGKLDFTRFDYWTWKKRAKIYLYPDKETYIKETKQPAWSAGMASYRDKKIWTYPRASGFFDSLLPHEIGHIVFREVIGGKIVPLWLEEGVAQYLEQAKRFGSEKTVIDAIKNNTFIPFDELNKIRVSHLSMRNDVDLFYAESINIVMYLVNKFGTRSFNDFLEKLRRGKSLDKALSYAYFEISGASDLGKLWQEELRRKIKDKPRVW